jgi:hypothetical protein
MVLKNLSLRESYRLILVCKMWSYNVFEVVHKEEVEFLRLFSSSTLEKTLSLPLKFLELKFSQYFCFTRPDLSVDIWNWDRENLLRVLREEFPFIKKNSDRLFVKYQKLLVKYHMLTQLSDPEESRFLKYLDEHCDLANSYIRDLRGFDHEFWEKHIRVVEKIKREISRVWWLP